MYSSTFTKFILIVVTLVVAMFFHGAESESSAGITTPLQTPNEIASQTFVVFYYGVNESDRYAINDFQRVLENPNFDIRKTSVMYVHGYKGSQMNSRTQAIKQAYQKRQHTHNMLALDWADLSNANSNYKIAIYNAVVVGQIVAKVFFSLLNDGILSTTQLSKFHLLGGSMGAHLIGVIGRTLIQISNNTYKFDRITGLDPANLGFPPLYSLNLSEKDAKFVDIIHTAMGVRGSSTTGSADFYPNGGVATQPGCQFVALNENDVCSHHRSVFFWAESVASKERTTFFAAAPRTWFSLDEEDIVNMGIDCPTTTRGKYFLQTNSSAPYSLGMDGIRYDPSIWNVKDPNQC